MTQYPSQNSTNDRFIFGSGGTLETGPFIIDVRTGEKGSAEQWVEAFSHAWSRGADALDDILALLNDEVVLRAPTSPPVSHGKGEAKEAFARVFRALPDLRGEVRCWASAGDVLFIEMVFTATVGGRTIAIPNIDRFLFKDGAAVERIAHFDPTILYRAMIRSLSGLVKLWRIKFG